MKCCKHCVITGRVQGVFYRQNTLEKAKMLGVTGWVRNLDNGGVECLICGEQAAVEALCQWLWEGPKSAQVSHVEIKESHWQEHVDFVIQR